MRSSSLRWRTHSLLWTAYLVVPLLASAQERDHSGHTSPPGHPPCADCDIYSQHDRTQRPFEFGQDILSAMQEMVTLLEGKTDTNWDAFDLDRFHTHLVDMQELVTNTSATVESLRDGLRISLSGPPRTLEALGRIIPDHAITLGSINGWDASVALAPEGPVLEVTSTSAEEVKHIKALGFMGLMVAGAGHHQPFHLALARGETEAGWPHLGAIEQSSAMPHMQMEGPHDMSASDPSPEHRTVLTDEKVQGLLEGKGLGYALAAELNHYPGPLHTLEMSEELALTEAQSEKVQSIYDDMLTEAVAWGDLLVSGEQALAEAFAGHEIDRMTLEEMVADLARLEGRLRVVHLTAHLKMSSLLTPYQVMLYDRMRGHSESEGMADHRGSSRHF